MAAASAMAAVRRVDRPFYVGTSGWSSRRSGGSPEEVRGGRGGIREQNHSSAMFWLLAPRAINSTVVLVCQADILLDTHPSPVAYVCTKYDLFFFT